MTKRVKGRRVPKSPDQCAFTGCDRDKVKAVATDNHTQLGLCKIHTREAKGILSEY